MSSMIFGTVEPMNGGTLTDRNENNLQKMFPDSPLPGYKGKYNQAAIENICKLAFQGKAAESGKIPTPVNNALAVSVLGDVNDAGYAFGTFNLNYNETPDISSVATGPKGMPGSPYAPNLNSPGEGSVDPLDLTEYQGTYTVTKQWGSGYDATSVGGNPAKVTVNGISQQLNYAETFTAPRTIGNYISGRSYDGSDGTP